MLSPIKTYVVAPMTGNLANQNSNDWREVQIPGGKFSKRVAALGGWL